MVKMATSNKPCVSSARSTKTSASSASARSTNTSASSASAACAQTKAEAAKVRASYASKEAKLKMEKAAREAEKLIRDAQNQLETVRIDTELEVLSLHREAYVAMVEAQVLEDAEAMHAAVEDGKSESARVKLERTSEYVQPQINFQQRSPSALVSVLPATSPLHPESHGSFITWRPPAKDIPQSQPFNDKPKSGKLTIRTYLNQTYLILLMMKRSLK